MKFPGFSTFLLFFLLSSRVAFSQTDTSIAARQSVWASIGGGLGTRGFCSKVSLSVQRGQHVFSARAFRIVKFIGDMVEPRSPRPQETETEVALLYGRDLSNRGGYFIFSLGIGYIISQHRGVLLDQPPFGLVHELNSRGSIGAAVDAQVFIPVSRLLGLGLSLAGNINASRFFGGILFTINIGSFD